MRSRFLVVFKKERRFTKRQKVSVLGDNYFVSNSDDAGGVARFTIFRNTPEGKEHVLTTDFHNVAYFLVYPNLDEE